MEYNDKFIYPEVNFLGYTTYKVCKFIIDRTDEKIILGEICELPSHFVEVKYENINEKILSFEKFMKLYIKNNSDNLKNIMFLSEFKKSLKDVSAFEKHARAILTCQEQIRYWEKYTKSKDISQVEFANKIIRENSKGIRRHNKRIYYIYKKYPNIDLKSVLCIDNKITLLEKEIKDNNENFNKIKEEIKS